MRKPMDGCVDRSHRAHRAAPSACAMVLAAMLIGAAGAAPAAAQAGSDIWLARLGVRDGRPAVGEPANITDRAGYDNQPSFTADGAAILYTMIDDSSQADIWRYDLSTELTRRLTVTEPESEYSATPLPGGGGFSVIRVERDSAQRLWRFDDDGTNPSVVLAGVAPVGYHAWADARRVAVFVLGQPATLQLADVTTGTARTVASDIGRAIQKIPGRLAISYVQRVEGGMRVDELNVETGATSPLIRLPDGGEYHAWLPDGSLLASAGSKLYHWRAGERAWSEVADFDAQGLRLSRLAVDASGTRIALVAAEGGS